MFESEMGICLEEATLAMHEGNIPIGAVLLDPNGVVVLQDHNRERVPKPDRTRHAEMNLLTRAAELGLGKGEPKVRLSGFHVVSTAEPCSGCASFAIKFGIRSFTFGAAAEPSMDPFITLDQISAASHEPLKIVGGVRADECATLIALGRDQIRKPQ